MRAFAMVRKSLEPNACDETQHPFTGIYLLSQKHKMKEQRGLSFLLPQQVSWFIKVLMAFHDVSIVTPTS